MRDAHRIQNMYHSSWRDATIEHRISWLKNHIAYLKEIGYDIYWMNKYQTRLARCKRQLAKRNASND